MFGFSPIKRDKKRLKRNALQSVTFQVKFNSIDSILEKKDLLQKEFSEQYPNLMDIMDSAAKITFSPEGTPIFESPPTSGGGFQFSSADSFKTLAVTKDTLNLSIFGKIYRNSSDVLNEFENCYIPVMKKIGVKNFNRVAIRKINILDVDGAVEEKGVGVGLGAISRRLNRSRLGRKFVEDPKNIAYEFFGLICFLYLLWSVPLADLVRFYFFFLSHDVFLNFF